MNETRDQGRAILIIIAIITLLFINVGIFYTTQVSRERDQVSDDSASGASAAKLDVTSLQQLDNRVHVDVEEKLKPYQSGRSNPFSN